MPLLCSIARLKCTVLLDLVHRMFRIPLDPPRARINGQKRHGVVGGGWTVIGVCLVDGCTEAPHKYHGRKTCDWCSQHCTAHKQGQRQGLKRKRENSSSEEGEKNEFEESKSAVRAIALTDRPHPQLLTSSPSPARPPSPPSPPLSLDPLSPVPSPAPAVVGPAEATDPLQALVSDANIYANSLKAWGLATMWFPDGAKEGWFLLRDSGINPRLLPERTGSLRTDEFSLYYKQVAEEW